MKCCAETDSILLTAVAGTDGLPHSVYLLTSHLISPLSIPVWGFVVDRGTVTGLCGDLWWRE